MLQIEPHRWFSWDFTVSHQGRPVAELDISWWRERGELTIDRVPYTVTREGFVSSDFRFDSAAGPLATATKPSVFHRRFVVAYGGRSVFLEPRSIWSRTLVVLDGAREVGRIEPTSMWSRRATATMPEDMPLPVRVFLIWLAVLLWKREAEASTATT